MKSTPAALLAHYRGAATTTAHALRITRPDNQVFGFTGASKSETIGGVLYDATQGLDVSSIATSAGLAVDNLELTTLDDGSLFTQEDVIGGVWQNSRFLIFSYNWASPTDGVDYLLSGTIGQVQLMRGHIVCELRGLQQYLQQPIGAVTSLTCRARFADFPTQNLNARCGLASASWTDGLSVTSVTSRSVFTIVKETGSVRATEWYDNGIITWTEGANAGLRARVKRFTAASPGEMELHVPAARAIVVGDRLQAVAGCRGRLAEDCRDRFNNVVNFQGEPHMPGVDVLTSTPEPQA